MRVCRGLQLALVPWTLGGRESPLAAGKLWPLAAGKLCPLAAGYLCPLAAGYLWPLGGRGLVISRISRGIPGLRSRFRASSRGFPGKFLDGMAQN